MPTSKAAAFITKDGKVTVQKLPSSEDKIVIVPLVGEHIDEPINLTNIVEVKFIGTNEKTPCPCCGALLPTFREE